MFCFPPMRGICEKSEGEIVGEQKSKVGNRMQRELKDTHLCQTV